MRHNKLKKHYVKTTFALFLLLIIPALSFAWNGKVVGVADGDTITVLNNNKPTKIRLYGVDCPEKSQPFGQKAKQFTSDKVFKKNVKIDPIDTDRYGRTVGLVLFDNGKSLNESLVESGLAWVYKTYCHKPQCENWLRIESAARTKKIGLWSMPDPVPPWQFRRSKKGISHSPASETTLKQTEYQSSQKSETKYHGNVSSKKFHEPGCKQYNCKNCTAVFKSRDEAIAAGYKPCGICNKQ